MTDIKKYGFDEYFQEKAYNFTDLCPGRIISQSKGIYRVVCESGELTAKVSGKLRFEAETAVDFPAVGDFVMLNYFTDSDEAVIRHVLPRRSVFIRRAAGQAGLEQVVAVNIDTVFICMSLNADFNPRRLERYVTVAWDSGAVPVVVLTKSDLCDDTELKIRAAVEIAAGVQVLAVTSVDDGGLEQITPFIGEGKTVAFIGSSGVGKSTMINRLLGAQVLETNGLRDDDKGRHTTTRRELFLLPGGGMVIDTPGMREMGIAEVSEGLDKTFADVEAIFGRCRFSDCTHTGEPGCAVAAAIGDGTLQAERWLSYLKLKSEADYSRDSAQYLEQKRQKFKEISKINKLNRGKSK